MLLARIHIARAFPAFLALALAAAGASAHPGPHERIAALTLALERRPSDAGLWIERAGEYLSDGDAAAALRDLDRARSLAPGRADALLVRGATLLALGRAAEAEEQLTLAVLRAPASAEARRLRARARMALGRPQGAAEDFGRAVALSPAPSPDDFLEWSRALESAGTERRAAERSALAALERGLVTLGECAALAAEAVRLDCSLGAWDDALARIDRHAGAWGSDAARRARRGDVLRVAGREIEAQAEYSAALAALEAGPRRPRGRAASMETRLRAALSSESSVPVSR
jgi:tetratricopeptide (TPR) repeat protein